MLRKVKMSTIRPVFQENPDNLVARKPEAPNAFMGSEITRKPFEDRPTNSTPGHNLKPRVQLIKEQLHYAQAKEEEDLINYDICSFLGKEVPDTFEDICSRDQRYNSEQLIQIFINFRGYNDKEDSIPDKPEMVRNDFIISPRNYGNTDITKLPCLADDSFDVSLPDIDF